jgi:uncharacterized protein (TIGR00369 family)
MSMPRFAPVTMTPAGFDAFGHDYLPGNAAIRIVRVARGEVCAQMPVTRAWMAPNDCLHGGAISVLADTAAGYGCLASLPPGAIGFLTTEMKSNHLAATRGGTVMCTARAAHLGRTTQVWDAVVTHVETQRTVALFRCTQLLLYPDTHGTAHANA